MATKGNAVTPPAYTGYTRQEVYGRQRQYDATFTRICYAQQRAAGALPALWHAACLLLAKECRVYAKMLPAAMWQINKIQKAAVMHRCCECIQNAHGARRRKGEECRNAAYNEGRAEWRAEDANRVRTVTEVRRVLIHEECEVRCVREMRNSRR